QQQNSYYFDLLEGKILQPLKITPIKKNGFQDYMKSIGKLGGQNKIQRLSNDRNLAEALRGRFLACSMPRFSPSVPTPLQGAGHLPRGGRGFVWCCKRTFGAKLRPLPSP